MEVHLWDTLKPSGIHMAVQLASGGVFPELHLIDHYFIDNDSIQLPRSTLSQVALFSWNLWSPERLFRTGFAVLRPPVAGEINGSFSATSSGQYISSICR